MSIKILGGELKGLPLFVPDTDKTRPTSVLLKRRLFDSRQHLDSFWFYDLCAGSGAIGLEALSRGAERLYAVELSHLAYKCLVKNVQNVKSKLGTSPLIKIYKQKFEKWLDSFSSEYLQFSDEEQRKVILFFDPPYENHLLYEKFLSTVLSDRFAFRGELWVESDLRKGPKESFWQEYERYMIKKFQQGTRIIYIFSRI